METLKATVLAALLAGAAPARAESVRTWSAPIAEASARFGLPAAWIRRVMKAESGGRTLHRGRPVVSRAGAMGLMQLMPATWNDMRALLNLGSDPFDPRDNILAGTLYLKLLYERFGYPGLFGAYNAGPARYQNYLAGRRTLPSETRAYLAAVSGQAVLPAPERRPPLRDRGSPATARATGLSAVLVRRAAAADLFVPLSGHGSRPAIAAEERERADR